jgi:ribosomal-protein-alanine N-acetyltransferase
MKIRAYEKTDLEKMMIIAPRAFMGLGLARFAIDGQLDRDRVSAYYSDEIGEYADKVERGDAIGILVCEEAGGIAGYIVVEVDGKNTDRFDVKWGRIVSLAVDPDYQAKGIGKSLVSRGLEWLSEREVEYVEVLTDQNNVAAQRVYESCGFRAIYASISYSRRL